MGLNEDLGDRENIGNAGLAAQRAREERFAQIIQTYPFLDPDFLTLMNDIGRIGHEKFGADAIEVTGGKRQIERHQKDAILVHAAEHLVVYKLGIPHDKLDTLQAHLAAAAFNCMLEFVFSQGEE